MVFKMIHYINVLLSAKHNTNNTCKTENKDENENQNTSNNDNHNVNDDFKIQFCK